MALFKLNREGSRIGMRVISGSAKGMRLTAPPGLETRPTADRIKESLFSIINESLYGSRFLDLFAGSGAIGIEALSRGAASAVFVDSSSEAVKFIDANLKHTKLHSKSSIVRQDIKVAIKDLYKRNICFDVIYMDPPYNYSGITDIVDNLADLHILAQKGVLIIEHSLDKQLKFCQKLDIINYRGFGKTTAITFLSWRNEGE